MKTLVQLTKDLDILEMHGDFDVEISQISIDSRTCTEGSLYVAISGGVYDGHNFIDSAIESGAIAVVCEKLPEIKEEDVTYIIVSNSHSAPGHIAAAFYNYPSRKVKLFGVTGTNGKTTVATLVYQFLQLLGKSSAVLSTAGDFFNGEILVVNRHAGTSVEIIEMNRILRELADADCEYCAFEVSSHALDQERIAGLEIKVAAFTNLSQDHLDYHHTMEAYAAAKKKLFDSLAKESYAVINIDDAYGEYMMSDCVAKISTYGLFNEADLRIIAARYSPKGSEVIIKNKEYQLPLLGRFNTYNVLATAQSVMLFGFEEEAVLGHIHELQPIAGRAEIVRHASGVTGVVDYAHTADGLENILSSVQDILNPDQRLITVVGCGGDRDTTKRKPMADMALRYSDYSILTSDNPRTEEPESIIDMMCLGLESSEKWTRITDRAAAITRALEYAQPGDVVLMAGKGHEEYQEIMGVKYPFSDREVFLSSTK